MCAVSNTVTLLLVEDDESLAPLLRDYLNSRGISVTTIGTLAEARDLLGSHHFDLVVLDLNLGSEDGLDLAREIAQRRWPPIVITSSRIDEADRVLGLELGAADYLSKPYSFRELLVRVKGIVKRTAQGGGGVGARRAARTGRWLVDFTARRVKNHDGREVALTSGEITLLKVFLEHPDHVLSRIQIIALVGRSDADVFDRAIDVLVGRLRRKLEDDPKDPQLIHTVRGGGYRFAQDVEWLLDSK